MLLLKAITMKPETTCIFKDQRSSYARMEITSDPQLKSAESPDPHDLTRNAKKCRACAVFSTGMVGLGFLICGAFAHNTGAAPQISTSLLATGGAIVAGSILTAFCCVSKGLIEPQSEIEL
ncbi:hypothetical protein AAKU58_002513 [Oxalobacteraceae bacterium GrIS 1.18]